MNNRNNYITNSISIFILLALFSTVILKISNTDVNFSVVFSFMFNGIIWLLLLGMELKKRAYSLELMTWLFSFLFFALAPLVQYSLKYFPWIHSRSDSILLKSNELLILWTIATWIGIHTFKIKIKRKSSNKMETDCTNILLILTIFNIANAIYRIKTYGMITLMSRGIQESDVITTPLTVLIENIIQAICFFTVIISIIYIKKTSKNWMVFIINLLTIILSYFPTGMARYAIAVIYLGILLCWYDKFKENRTFTLLFIFSFMIILPFFSAFRSVVFLSVDIGENLLNSFGSIISNLKNNDYDAYTQFTLTVEYVRDHGAGGNHILTDLLFWVPRSLWTEKAYSGSYEIAQARGLFTNVSFPFAAIGYMDGRTVGMMLWGWFVGIFIGKFDKWYWEIKRFQNNKFTEALYNVSVIYWFFLARGDMFYVFPFYVAYVIAWVLIKKVSDIKLKFSNKN